MAKIDLEDWYDICERFEKKTNAKLSWALGFMGWDYDDGEALRINRDFLKLLNQTLTEKGGSQDGEV